MKAELWQHPFVDIFKLVNLNEWRVGQKEGDVNECLDRVTGKRVFRLAGAVSAANYIQIPRAKSQLKTLGLTGQYVYLQLLEVPEKLSSIHLEYSISNSKTRLDEPLRITLSNIYKETKLTNSGLQLSCHLGNKWTVVVLDVRNLLQKFVGSHITAHTMRSLTICSTLFVKGVYTSDILYHSGNLPKEMSFKLGREQNWLDVYDWTVIDAGLVRQKTAVIEKIHPQPLIEEEDQTPNQIKPESFPKLKPPSSDPTKESTKPENQSSNLLKIDQKPQSISRPTPSPKIPEKPEIKEKSEKSSKPGDLMLPDPLMSLNHVIGYSGNNSRTVKWTKQQSVFTCYPRDFTQSSSKFIVYPSGCTLVLMNPVSRKQHFLFGHTAPINSLSLNGSLIVSGQASPALTLVWEIKTMRAPTFIAFGKLSTLKAVDVSHDCKHVVTAGTDTKARETIIVWDITGITQGKPAEIKAKQVSNFHINTIKFSPIDSERLMSCGKESIRSWRINRDHLSGKAVVLSHHARASEFLDLDYDIFTSTSKSLEVDAYLKRIFVVSNQGMLFQINYESTELEGVLQLHDSAINSIMVAEGYCVTGSDDCFLRVWPLDFSEYLLEARHEGPVVSVDISMDRYNIVCGTSNCTIGSLDISTNAYRTLLRSHTAPVLAVDIHPASGMLLTASEDKTLRIWSPEHFEEQFEFFSPQDLPLTVSFHPLQNLFACGFESGSLRIFEVETTSMKDEFLQHETKIVKCVHSLDGKFLLSASEDGVVCLYDSLRKYQPVKTIPVEVLGEKVDVCFSFDSKQFAVLGTYNSIIFIWEVQTFSQKFRINTAGFVIQKMIFAPNGQDLLVVSYGQDYKVKFYGLNGFEAIFIKEFSGCHPSAEISDFAVSQNSKYLVTGGSDKLIKLWEYGARQNSLRSQGFIGHSYQIQHLRFSLDRNYLISCAAGPDGIFVWKFNGDTSNSATPYGLN
jgi:WD40 repeat protein